MTDQHPRLGEPDPQATFDRFADAVVDALGQLEPEPPGPNDRCAYCSSPDGLAHCCRLHPDVLICRHCRPGKPSNHQPPDGRRARRERGAIDPPYPDRLESVAGWARYRELLEDLGVRVAGLVACSVCGGLMMPNRARAHGDCLTPGVRDVVVMPAGARLVDVVGSEAWRDGTADALAKLAAIEAPGPEAKRGPLDPLLGPPCPVDVGLDPDKAWTDWAAVIGEIFGNPPHPGHEGVQ